MLKHLTTSDVISKEDLYDDGGAKEHHTKMASYKSIIKRASQMETNARQGRGIQSSGSYEGRITPLDSVRDEVGIIINNDDVVVNI